MARGDGKAQRGYTRGRSVVKMAAGGNLAARDAAMGGAAVGSRAEASRGTGGLGASTRDGGFGAAGPVGGGNQVNRAAKSDRLGPSELGAGALRDYANRRIASTFDASGSFRAPQTVNTAAKGDFSPSQVVNTAAKGDILSTQMPTYAARNKPGMAANFRALEAAGLGAYTGNTMPGRKNATRGLDSTRGSFGGFGVNEGPQTDMGDLIAGVQSNRSRGIPVSNAAEYYSSLPSRSRLEGAAEPDRVASYMETRTSNMGPRNTPSSGQYGGQTSRAEPSGQGGKPSAAPASTAQPARGPSNVVAGRTNFGPAKTPLEPSRNGGGGGGGRRRKKPIITEEAVTNARHGGSIRGDGKAAFGKTKGRYI